MADYLTAHRKTAANEAGYSFDSVDKGGETWVGITRRNHADWAGWSIIDAAKAQLGLGEGRDLPKKYRTLLTQYLREDAALEALVVGFYKPKYWDVLGLDAEPSQAIAEKVHDIAVYQGVNAARKMLAEVRGNA